MRDHVTNHYIFLATVHIATKLILTYLEEPLTKSHLTPWLSGLATSSDKQKPFYIHCHCTNGNQTWQGDNLPWWAPTFKATRPFDNVAFWDHVTNYNHYISTTAVPMTIKLRRVVSHVEGLLLLGLYGTKPDPLNTWFCLMTRQTENIVLINLK